MRHNYVLQNWFKHTDGLHLGSYLLNSEN